MNLPETLDENSGEGSARSNESDQSAGAGNSEEVSSVSLVDAFAQAGATQGDAAAPYGYRADGTPRAKPGRRPKNPQQSGDADAPAPAAPRPKSKLEAKSQQVSAQELSRAICNLAIGALCASIGPEWEPQDPEEGKGLVLSLAAYLEAKGDGKVTPEMMLLLIFGSYSVSRFKHPNTRSKLGGFFGKAWTIAKSGFKAIFRR